MNVPTLRCILATLAILIAVALVQAQPQQQAPQQNQQQFPMSFTIKVTPTTLPYGVTDVSGSVSGAWTGTLTPTTMPATSIATYNPAWNATNGATVVLDPTGNFVNLGDYNTVTDWVVNAAQPAAARPHTAYMGVGVEAPGETLRAQLKLAEGMGMVVNYVDDNGPSKGLIQQHDVLQKLDDQWLANGDQLVALVRMHKPGDSVQVSLIRESKSIAVALKLTEKDVASSSSSSSWSSPATSPSSSAAQAYEALFYSNAIRGAGDYFRPVTIASATTQPAQVTVSSTYGLDPAVLQLGQGLYVLGNGTVVAANAPTTAVRTAVTTAPSTQPVAAVLASGELVRLAAARWLTDSAVVARATRAGPVTIDDGEMLMWLQPGRDGAAELTVVERATGKVTFRGPIGTTEQWEKVPQDVREKFDAWKSALEQSGSGQKK
jgi:hypothetical protein